MGSLDRQGGGLGRRGGRVPATARENDNVHNIDTGLTRIEVRPLIGCNSRLHFAFRDRKGFVRDKWSDLGRVERMRLQRSSKRDRPLDTVEPWSTPCPMFRQARREESWRVFMAPAPRGFYPCAPALRGSRQRLDHQGRDRSQLAGGPARPFKVGQSFFERTEPCSGPANDSNAEPEELIAVFVEEMGAQLRLRGVVKRHALQLFVILEEV